MTTGSPSQQHPTGKIPKQDHAGRICFFNRGLPTKNGAGKYRVGTLHDTSELLTGYQWTTNRSPVDYYQVSSGLLSFLLTTVSAYRHIKGTVARYLLRNLTIFRDTTLNLIGELYERVTILPPLHRTKYPPFRIEVSHLHGKI